MQTIMKDRLLNKLVILPFIFSLLIATSIPESCQSQDHPTDPIPALSRTAAAFTSIIEEAKPAVVNILVKRQAPEKGTGNTLQQEFFEKQLMKDFFSSSPDPKKEPLQQQPRYGNGSGFIISEDGYIITNHHVVKDAVEIIVHLHDKREYHAITIGSDRQADIALLQIQESQLPALTLGDSDTLQVGEWALAIGAPFGFIQTVTAGIISAKGRSNIGISEYEDLIQTDAAINPGNSGGPLLNIHGEVIGINTAFMTQQGGYMGIGFAVPINMAKIISRQLKEHGKMIRGWLGVALKDVPPVKLSTSANQEIRDAAKVIEVTKNSPADRGELKKDDLIIALNSKPISGAADLRNQIALTRPGTSVQIQFLRGGKKKETNISIGNLPQ